MLANEWAPARWPTRLEGGGATVRTQVSSSNAPVPSANLGANASTPLPATSWLLHREGETRRPASSSSTWPPNAARAREFGREDSKRGHFRRFVAALVELASPPHSFHDALLEQSTGPICTRISNKIVPGRPGPQCASTQLGPFQYRRGCDAHRGQSLLFTQG